MSIRDVKPRDRHMVLVGRRRRKVFLQTLRETGNVLRSAQRAGYADTKVLRSYYNDSEEFASEWDAALMAGTDRLIDEAHRRGVEGERKPVLYKGRQVYVPDPETKLPVPLYERACSDQLLMMLIRAHRPEYRDKSTTEVNANVSVGVALLPIKASDTASWEQQMLDYQKTPKLLPGEDGVYVPEPTPADDTVQIRRS